MTQRARVFIIGGGVIGLSIAYHLGKLGWKDVTLVEKNTLTSGTSWHAAGIVGPLRATLAMTRLAMYAVDLFERLEEETGQATGYTRTGGYWLARTPDRMEELKRIKAIGDCVGIKAEIVTPQQIAERLPLARTEDLAGGLYVEGDGQANPVDICMAYARGAKASGVRIIENCGVGAMRTAKGRVESVTLDDGRVLETDIVVNCAGVWSSEIGRMAGHPAAVQAVEHMYVVTEALDGLPAPFPVVRDLDARIYLKGDAGKLVLGGFEPEAKPWDTKSVAQDASFLTLPEDWDQFMPFMEAGLHRFPFLEKAGIQFFMNGPEGFTPDTRQVMGPVPGMDGYFIAAGFNSLGIVSSAGAGRALADWIDRGEAPIDLFELDVARLDAHAATPTFLKDRMREAVSNQFDMHWPLKQPKTARNVKTTPFHQAFAARGAVFGNAAGWERPFWYAQNAEEAEFRYSFGVQHWWSMAEREARGLMRDVALFELTPFTKIDLCGPDALDALQELSVSDCDVPIGRAVYTQWLNSRGGIEADVTITRLAEDRFRITAGATTRHKDLDHIRRAIGERRAYVFDATSSEAVLGVMGPKSRALLRAVSSSDFGGTAFPFAHSRMVDIGMAMARATRISFVGELGWELSIPNEVAGHVMQMLLDAGADFGLGMAGHLMLDGCRIEKAFRHWGHDIGADHTPLEAGLGFTVKWDKPVPFRGRDALLELKETGLRRHLLLFDVSDGEGGPPLLLHDEPIHANGERIGLTTSGGRGPRTLKNLAFGYVDCAPCTTRKSLAEESYEIEVAGRRYPARVLLKPAYDPSGERMRG